MHRRPTLPVRPKIPYLPNWARHNGWHGNGNGGKTNVDEGSRQCAHRPESESDNPATWTDFETAKGLRRDALLVHHPGIGYVVHDPYTGLDFDTYRDPDSGDGLRGQRRRSQG